MTRPTPDQVSFDDAQYVLHVGKDSISCKRKGHKVESVTGILASTKGRQVKINVNYCRQCNLFYIGKNEYEHYRELFGNLLGNFRFDSVSTSSGHDFSSYLAESVLMQCGYNVSARENLSEVERRLILENVLDRRILTKEDVMSHLRWLIRTRSSMQNMQDAISKWQADLQWVRNFRINSQRHFVVSGVTRW